RFLRAGAAGKPRRPLSERFPEDAGAVSNLCTARARRRAADPPRRDSGRTMMTDMLPIPPLPEVVIEPLVRLALIEDLGPGGDITTDAVIPADARMTATMRAREPGVAAGYDAARLVLKLIDPDACWTTVTSEGVAFAKGAELVRVSGSARSVLMAERTMLNFI